jgi:VanZ family protein|tara:strand:- start:6159 stop:6512 length:354 start_codon:yes stop_codon:yes gene_type:complete
VSKINLIFALVYTALIVFLGLSESESISLVGLQLNDKLAHFISFLLFTFLWKNSFNYFIEKNALFYLFIFALIFSVFIELGQKYLTISRNAELLDIVFNLLGILLAYIYFSLKERKI